MTNDEMIETGKMLLDYEHECQILQKKIDALIVEQKDARSHANDMHNLLIKTVGANIQERIIPIEDKAIVVTYNPMGSTLRISHHVVT